MTGRASGLRIGLIADIHANLPALEAALETLGGSGCDTVVNLGDAFTIGPFPAETVALLRERGIPSLAGNHEDDLLLGFSPEMDLRMSDGEREHYLWTFDRLSDEAREYIASFPHTLDVPVAGTSSDAGHVAGAEARGGPMRCVHYYLGGGRVVDVRMEVDRRTMQRAFGTDCAVLAFGHTHRTLVMEGPGPLIINPGTCGLHHTGGPTVAVVDLQVDDGQRSPGASGEGPTCTILPVEYDPAPVLAELNRRGVPDHEYIRNTFFHGA